VPNQRAKARFAPFPDGGSRAGSHVGAKPVEENDLVLNRLRADLASRAIPKSPRNGWDISKLEITWDLYGHVMPGMQEDAAARVDAALQAAKNTARRMAAKR
jgi:hypothetical protein